MNHLKQETELQKNTQNAATCVTLCETPIWKAAVLLAVLLLNKVRLSRSRNKRQSSIHQLVLPPLDNYAACLLQSWRDNQAPALWAKQEHSVEPLEKQLLVAWCCCFRYTGCDVKFRSAGDSCMTGALTSLSQACAWLHTIYRTSWYLENCGQLMASNGWVSGGAKDFIWVIRWAPSFVGVSMMKPTTPPVGSVLLV